MSDAWLVRGDWEAAHGSIRARRTRPRRRWGRRVGLVAAGVQDRQHRRARLLVARHVGGEQRARSAAGAAAGGRDHREGGARQSQRRLRLQQLVRHVPDAGRVRVKRGLDPSATLKRALPPCEKAIAIDSEGASTQQSLACVQLDIAVWQRMQRIDPGPQLERARTSLRRSLHARSRVRARLLHARRDRARGGALGGRSRRLGRRPRSKRRAPRTASGRAQRRRGRRAARAGVAHRLRAEWSARTTTPSMPTCAPEGRGRQGARDQRASRDGRARSGRAAPRGRARRLGDKRKSEAAEAHEKLLRRARLRRQPRARSAAALRRSEEADERAVVAMAFRSTGRSKRSGRDLQEIKRSKGQNYTFRSSDF